MPFMGVVQGRSRDVMPLTEAARLLAAYTEAPWLKLLCRRMSQAMSQAES